MLSTYSDAVETFPQDFSLICRYKLSENHGLRIAYIETRAKENLKDTELITAISNGVLLLHIFTPKARLESESE